MGQRVDWTDTETKILIDIWGEDSVQLQLEGCKRNRQVYEKIATSLKAAGYERTAVQCREKIKKLRAEYKKIIDNNNETGRDRKDFLHFARLNEILGHRPATQPQHVVDTSAPGELSDKEEAGDVIEGDDTMMEETQNEGKDDRSETQGSTIQEAKTIPNAKNKEMKKRKRTVKEGTVEKVMDIVLTKICRMQEDSDSKFYEMERKRLEFDQRMMELEERHRQHQEEREERYRKEQEDREMQRRREDYQFRLEMMQMMRGQTSYQSSHFSPFDVAEPAPSERMYHWGAAKEN